MYVKDQEGDLGIRIFKILLHAVVYGVGIAFFWVVVFLLSSFVDKIPYGWRTVEVLTIFAMFSMLRSVVSAIRNLVERIDFYNR